MFESGMNEELKKKVDVVVGLSRLAGGSLLIVGSILVFFFFKAALDPNGIIEINGVPTKDSSEKLAAAALSVLFPILGVFFSFAPSKLLDRWAASIIVKLG